MMGIDPFTRTRGFQMIQLAAALFAAASAALPAVAADDPVSERFQALDADRNGKLTLDEYVQQEGTRKCLERDLRVFDFDSNGVLTRAEFAAIPGIVPEAQRGPLPDPLEDLLAAAVDAMDETYGNWSRRPQQTVPAQQFVIDFLTSLSPDGRQRYDASLLPLGDADGNQQVTWDEAQRFLEIQLGVRWPTGHLLRQPNGRFLMMRHFLWGDADKDGAITRSEFVDGELFTWTGKDREDVFRKGDLNGDGKITLDEYANPDWVAYEDPIIVFLRWDRNLDGLLDDDEIAASARDYLDPLKPSTVKAFDLDEDGKLSLNEFRISMMGNRFLNWASVPSDKDRDRRLSFDEFAFSQGQCHLLRTFYFHRLDRNEDGKLSLDEYTFEVLPPSTFHVLATDGSEFRLLFRNEEYPRCGSPDVSPDGKRIAFDGFPGGVTIQGSRILLINSDGSGFQDLCAGLMPTWSNDGKQLACSRYGGGGVASGVWIINADGSDHKRIDSGWGAQWSPDGSSIAYTKSGGIWVYDVPTGQSHQRLPRGEHPFASIYYNMSWSPDSQRLAFAAASPKRESVLASVSMAGEDPDLQVHFTTPQKINPDITFSPDGKRILFGMNAKELKRSLLYELNIDRDDPPRLIEGTDPAVQFIGGVTFTADRSGIILVTRE